MDIEVVYNDTEQFWCSVEESPTSLLAVLLIGSVGVILILSLLERRTNPTRCGHFQRPGLVIPLQLVGKDKHRLAYAAAFGSTASFSFQIFTQATIMPDVPGWATTLALIGTVVLYGLLVYPLFACITTEWVKTGSLLGAGYTSGWLGLTLYRLVNWIEYNGTETASYYIRDGLITYIAFQLPMLICQMFLIIRFCNQLVYSMIVRCVGRTDSQERAARREWSSRFAMDHHRAYVRQLLGKGSTVLSDDDYSLMKYRVDPTFKYSTMIVAVFTVALICLYQFCTLVAVGCKDLYHLSNSLLKNYNGSDGNTNHPMSVISQLNILLHVTTAFVSFILTVLFSVRNVMQILVNYRANVWRMYRGKFGLPHFKRIELSAPEVMSSALAFAGSQIAYILWGFIIPFVCLILVCLVVAYLLVLPALNKTFWNLTFFFNILPGICLSITLNYVQLFFSRALLQKRKEESKDGKESSIHVLALNNRKLFFNVSFFMFFFYIVVGFFGCLLNILKSIGLGIFYQSFLDRSRLMTGYETWDLGHVCYVNFLHLETSHRHPVLLVFCDVIKEFRMAVKMHKMKNYSSFESVIAEEEGAGCFSNIYTVSQPRRLARFRWLKAYTLIRNPGLVNCTATEVGQGQCSSYGHSSTTQPHCTSVLDPISELQVIPTSGDGRCLFRSLVIGMDTQLQTAKRLENGQLSSPMMEIGEKSKADCLRAKVIGFLCEHYDEYNELDKETINADLPSRLRYSSIQDRISAMADPLSMPGELEITAIIKVLERPICLLNSQHVVIQNYGKDIPKRNEPLLVQFESVGQDVGHYSCVVRQRKDHIGDASRTDKSLERDNITNAYASTDQLPSSAQLTDSEFRSTPGCSGENIQEIIYERV